MPIKGVKPGQKRDFMNETVIWDIFPEKTNLLVVDMTNCFCDPSGSVYIPKTAGIIKNINQLASFCRKIGITVTWMRVQLRNYPNDWKHFFDFYPDAKERPMALDPGTPGVELYPQMDKKPGDWEVVKNRYSPFAPHSPSSPSLDKLLRTNDKDTIIIVGTNTNICCETTARDAMNLDYKVVFVSDACATYDDRLHDATVTTMRNAFAMVCTTEELMQEIQKQTFERKDLLVEVPR